jgi:hypothetical protein
MKSLTLAFCLLAAVGGWGQAAPGCDIYDSSKFCGATGLVGWIGSQNNDSFECILSQDLKSSVDAVPPSKLPDCIDMLLPIITRHVQLPSVEPMPAYFMPLEGGPFVIIPSGSADHDIEPIDVPAIQEMREAFVDGITWTCGGYAGEPWDMDTHDNGHSFTCQRWTCTDPARGLWHTEDGHYFCRKPQP